jgi:hypothetical protein
VDRPVEALRRLSPAVDPTKALEGATVVVRDTLQDAEKRAVTSMMAAIVRRRYTRNRGRCVDKKRLVHA